MHPPTIHPLPTLLGITATTTTTEPTARVTACGERERGGGRESTGATAPSAPPAFQFLHICNPLQRTYLPCRYPSWAVLVTEWLEPDEYALASGTFSAGSCVGIVVAWLAGPAIIDTKVLGWRWAFWGSSLLTLPWLLAWVLVAASRPPSTLLQVQTRSSHRYIDVADDDRRAQRQLIKPLLNTDDDGDDGGDGAGESINSSSRASRSRSSRSRSRSAANGTRHAKPRNGSLPNIYQNIDHDDSIDDADSIDDGRSNEIDFDKPGTPREIASSPAFLGSLVVGFVGSWAVYMFLTFLPQYMQQRFNFQLAKAGWVSMLPYLARGLVLFATGTCMYVTTHYSYQHYDSSL